MCSPFFTKNSANSIKCMDLPTIRRQKRGANDYQKVYKIPSASRQQRNCRNSSVWEYRQHLGNPYLLKGSLYFELEILCLDY